MWTGVILLSCVSLVNHSSSAANQLPAAHLLLVISSVSGGAAESWARRLTVSISAVVVFPDAVDAWGRRPRLPLGAFTSS